MAILNALEQMCTWRKEWTVVSRNCIKKLLVETGTFVFTDIPLLILEKNGLKVFKENTLEVIPIR